MRTLYTLPVITPVACCTRYLSQVLPDPGNEASATTSLCFGSGRSASGVRHHSMLGPSLEARSLRGVRWETGTARRAPAAAGPEAEAEPPDMEEDNRCWGMA